MKSHFIGSGYTRVINVQGGILNILLAQIALMCCMLFICTNFLSD